MARGKLIGRDAGIGAADARFLRRYAREPGALDEFMRLGAFRRLVAQARDDGHVLAVGSKRLEDPRHRVVAAGFFRLPVAHHGAVRKADEREPLWDLAGRLAPGRSRD